MLYWRKTCEEALGSAEHMLMLGFQCPVKLQGKQCPERAAKRWNVLCQTRRATIDEYVTTC